MTFKQYLRTVRSSEAPASSFVQDARDDPDLPNASTWKDLEAYLVRKRALPDVLKAAKHCWDTYEAGGFGGPVC